MPTVLRLLNWRFQFYSDELRRIEVVVFERQQFFKEKWHEFFQH
jgi:hypothetical protein